MKLIIDSADVTAIKKLDEYYPIDGITTNPSILAKSGRKPYEVLAEIRSINKNWDLHVQTISKTADEIIKEAETITNKLGKNTFIKIPVTFEGVKAIKILTQNGINCTGTAVYTLEQALMAAKSGAKWIAPYVNRIEKLGNDAIKAVSDMQMMFKNNNYDTKIVGASFHRIEQITELAKLGIDAVTVNPDLLFNLLNNSVVDEAVDKFVLDFETLCGKNATMA